VRKSDSKVIAIFCADMHLSHEPPLWRSVEPDWYEAMKRPLLELRALQKIHNCPVLHAGDVFDKWFGSVKNCSELINFALDYLPNNFYSIAGQHDLPMHNLSDIGKSAYWTLVKSGKIDHIGDMVNISSSNITVYGHSYGEDVQTIINKSTFYQIALIHKYIWMDGHSHPNAPKDSQIPYMFYNDISHDKKTKGYDLMVFGDNHKGFIQKLHNTTIINCGSLMRRKSDEIDYKPAIWLLHQDGTVEPHYLGIKQDKYIDVNKLQKKITEDIDMSSCMEELEKLTEVSLDFKEALWIYTNTHKCSKKIVDILLEATGD
jgi:DNA repair exonuclease SbcCD nuclease subunit